MFPSMAHPPAVDLIRGLERPMWSSREPVTVQDQDCERTEHTMTPSACEQRERNVVLCAVEERRLRTFFSGIL